jgi:signal transduction histidine kinase
VPNEILLNVDDHEVARYARSRILTGAGFTVYEAGSGAETIEAVAKYRPDLVLLDVHLPDINGMEVCRTLKENMGDAPFIVLQITASAISPSHATTSLESGADAYLTEPMDPDVLVATVRAMLRLHNAERSLAHANRQLEITNRELMRSNIDLSHFAYAASHDLQEPLRTISIYTDLMRASLKGRLDEKEESYFAHVISSAQRMRSLITDTLAYSQAGRETLAKGVVDLKEVVNWATANLARSIDATQTRIEIAEGLPSVIGDFARLGQVFQNLLSNAIKYRIQPGEPLLVQIQSEKFGESNWKVTVKDSGPGIEEQYQKKIFDPFKRLHGSEIPGSGIGLALCRRVIEAHGGQIWVESEPGQGATFAMTLPGA